MALGTNMGAVVAGGDYHQTGSTQYHALGTKMELNDGRIFRYIQADGTGFAAGRLLDHPVANTANHTNVHVAAAPIGQKYVDITLGATAAAENLYAGGYFWVNDGTGEGHVYTISGHPSSAGGAALRVSLEEPLAIALVASGTTEASLVSNPYKGIALGVAEASLVSLHCGVSPVAIAASGYGWMQTKGFCSIIATGTGPTAFKHLISGATGGVSVATAVTELFGQAITWIAEDASGNQIFAKINFE